MSDLNYQKDYWKNFAATSEENVLAKDLNNSWNAETGEYSSHTEIPKEYINYLSDKISFDKVLDFGVGFGRNQKYLKSIFKEVHGFDLPEMISRYKNKADKQDVLLDDFNQINNDYSLLYETTVFQYMPPQEALAYLMNLALRCKYYFSWTRSYNDFLRNFKMQMGGLNMHHLIRSTNFWQPIMWSDDKMDSLNDETHYFVLYKSKVKC